jgi:hypothetical protein
MIERQEIYCHNCGKYVQFNVDVSLDGNHVLECPNCGHEHCRVVKNGIITGDRWDSRNGQTYTVTSGITFTTSSTYATASSGSSFAYTSWMNSTTVTMA